MKLFVTCAMLLVYLAVCYGQNPQSGMTTGNGMHMYPGGMWGIPFPLQAAFYDVDFSKLYKAEIMSQLLGSSPWARLYAGNLYDMPNYYWLTSGTHNGQAAGAGQNIGLLAAMAGNK